MSESRPFHLCSDERMTQESGIATPDVSFVDSVLSDFEATNEETDEQDRHAFQYDIACIAALACAGESTHFQQRFVDSPLLPQVEWKRSAVLSCLSCHSRLTTSLVDRGDFGDVSLDARSPSRGRQESTD